MPAPPRGRHRAPRSSHQRGALLLPAVLLSTGGLAFAGLGGVPAAAVGHAQQAVLARDLPGVGAPAPATHRATLPATLPGPSTDAEGGSDVDDPLDSRAAGDERDRRLQAARARAAAAARASRARRVAARRTAALAAARTRTVRPTDGPLTSRFGPRWGRLHAGIDFGVATGTPVRAVAAGSVVKTGSDAGGYGTFVHVRHTGGTVTTYSHLSEVERRDGAVLPGDVIGRSGSTGRSTGPHLHFEVRVRDEPVDPLPWLRARGVDLPG